MCVKNSNSSRVKMIEMSLNDFHDFVDCSSRFEMNKIIKLKSLKHIKMT